MYIFIYIVEYSTIHIPRISPYPLDFLISPNGHLDPFGSIWIHLDPLSLVNYPSLDTRQKHSEKTYYDDIMYLTIVADICIGAS